MERRYFIGMILFITVLMVGMWSKAAEAKPEYFAQIPEGYEASCLLCHSAPPVLNEFGEGFKNILQGVVGDPALAFQKLEESNKSEENTAGADHTLTETKDNVADDPDPNDKFKADESVEKEDADDNSSEEAVALPGSTNGPTSLKLTVLGEVTRGEQVELQTTLLDDAGNPISGAIISFVVPASLFIDSDMHITQARTSANGQATIRYTPKLEGDIQVVARYSGNEKHQPAEASVGMSLEKGIVLYNSDWSSRVPFMSPILIFVVLAIVWSAYAVTVREVVGIWQEGRLEERQLEAMREKSKVG